MDCPRKAEIIVSALTARLPFLVAKRRHALKEPRRHHGRAVAFAGTAQNHFAFAHGLREIMRRLAEFALRRSEAQRGAHGPVEKSVGACLGRPNRLIEAAKQYDIDVDEAPLEKPEDLEARMRPRRLAQDDFARDRRKKKPVGFDVEGNAVWGVLHKLVE